MNKMWNTTSDLSSKHHSLMRSLLIPLRLYTLPYWFNPQFFIFDIRALWCSELSARVPKCQKN